MEDQDVTSEALPVAARLPSDLAILKVENETMSAMAAVRPRDLKKISQGLVEQIREFPAFAATVLYARPVGKDDSGAQKVATGLSIRAAEAIAEAYGFNRVWSQVKLLEDGNAEVSASFTDFQRGRVTSASTVVSRTYQTRSKQTVAHSQDRFLDVVCKAAQSKLIRDVIVRSVPPALKSTLELAVRTSTRIGERTAQQIVEYFAEHLVSQAEIETYLASPKASWSDVHRQRLLEIRNAIEPDEDGVAESTIEDFFGPRPDSAAKAEPEKGAAPAASNATAKSVQSSLLNPSEVPVVSSVERHLTPEEMAEADRQYEERQKKKGAK